MIDCITENNEYIREFLLRNGFNPFSVTKPSYKWIMIAPKTKNRAVPFYYEVTTRYANKRGIFNILPKVTNEELITIIKNEIL